MARGHVWVSRIENNGMICFEICIKEAEVHLVVGGVLCKTKARREIIRIIRKCLLIPQWGNCGVPAAVFRKREKTQMEKLDIHI